MNKKATFCHICNEYTMYTPKTFFKLHVKKIHNLSAQEYYDEYIKKSEDNICNRKGCENETKFINPSNGYRQYCCVSCSSSDTKEKARQTYFKKTGYYHNMYNPESIEKQKNTNLDRYGVESYFQKEGFYVESAEKKKKKYNSVNNIEQIKNTNLKKYGVENVFQLESAQGKTKETLLEKYGVDNPMKNEKVKQRAN